MIIDRDSSPNETILYTSACISHTLKLTPVRVDKLYKLVKSEFNLKVSYTNFLLSLDFLFLIEQIQIKRNGEVYVIK